MANIAFHTTQLESNPKQLASGERSITCCVLDTVGLLNAFRGNLLEIIDIPLASREPKTFAKVRLSRLECRTHDNKSNCIVIGGWKKPFNGRNAWPSFDTTTSTDSECNSRSMFLYLSWSVYALRRVHVSNVRCPYSIHCTRMQWCGIYSHIGVYKWCIRTCKIVIIYVYIYISV